MPWITQKKYEENRQEDKWKMEIEFRQRTHENDCTEYRKMTQGVLQALHETLRANKEIWSEQIREVREEQKVFHKQNLGSLRWQRSLLFTILLALLGYFTAQAWEKLESIPKPSSPVHHSEFNFDPQGMEQGNGY